ncbi:MAG TPA: CaiB/BaiF CoA-transferase family protein [Jatrophihabitantaceae bacterium]|nr:CaiB/BaiF CoA-transferase family protein [Jatrophihabitantaceae bacterium]
MGGGPLDGVTVIDVSTLGPGPFASMVLADFGAEVIEIRRPGPVEVDAADQFVRGKKQLTIDLRAEGGAELIARLSDTADVFLESYRPGTMERRGLGPDVLLARNPRLVYTRLTGWGQAGPYAPTAGHDINYVAIGGPLGAVGTDAPVPALNLMGDFAGGSLPAVLGTVMALLTRERTGRGQIVDAGMVDGAAYLMFAQFAEMALGRWHGRGTSVLSGVAPFYTVYRCADGAWMSVGSIESKFYAQLIKGLDLDEGFVQRQHDRERWAEDRSAIAAVFATQPRDHWTALFAGSDACAYPVLELADVARDQHVTARGSVVLDAAGLPLVSPAPKLSETPGSIGAPPQLTRAAQLAVLAARGITTDDVERYRESGALHLPDEA